jgi:hypothetical protein
LQIQIRSRVTLDWAQQFDSSIVTSCWNATAGDCAAGCVWRDRDFSDPDSDVDSDTAVTEAGCVSNSSRFAQYYQAAFDRRAIVGPELSMGFEPATLAALNGSLLGGRNAALFEQVCTHSLTLASRASESAVSEVSAVPSGE